MPTTGVAPVHVRLGEPSSQPHWPSEVTEQRASARKQRLSNSPRTFAAAVAARWSEQCRAAYVHRMLAGLTPQQQ
jgi:hypothetical protein